MALVGTLGCVQEYTVLVVTKAGVPLGALNPSAVQWSRVLDDVSDCVLTIESNPFCCDILSTLRTWHYEVQLYRDGEYVWSGPIVQITGGRTQVTIVANDLFALLGQRIIHDPLCFATACGGSPNDLTVLGTAIIEDALTVDGHRFSIVSQPTGITGQRLYSPGENALTVFKEALALGLDATMLGPRFILGAANGVAPFGRSATLMCDDFVGDLQFEEDGLALATRAVTLGTGFVGVAKSPGSDANGEDPYYGLLEYVSPSRPELVTQSEADIAAGAIISSRYPVPVTLIVPDGSQLAQTAPIPISGLVPGVVTTIIADCLCRPVTADMILSKVEVSWDGTNGEKVSVTYVSLGSTNSGLNGGN